MKLFGAHDHLLALTDAVDADLHKHSFIQVSISLESPFEIEVDEKCFSCKGIVIDSNIINCINGRHNQLLFLLIDSTSCLAASFKKRIGGHHIYIFPDEMLNEITAFVKDSYGSIDDNTCYAHFLAQLLWLLDIEYVDSEPADQRIIEVISLLKDCDGSEHSIDILASQVNLSNSRLSHLFKENTGITLRCIRKIV